jgi:hypothetical protein
MRKVFALACAIAVGVTLVAQSTMRPFEDGRSICRRGKGLSRVREGALC